jgi:transcriptional regulator with XRE-family HTH domain
LHASVYSSELTVHAPSGSAVGAVGKFGR